MGDEEIFRPVKVFAYWYFIAVGVLGLLLVVASVISTGFSTIKILNLGIGIMHILIGVAILSRKRFAYYIMVGYLNLLRPMFPIFSFIAKDMLEYIKNNDAKSCFK